MTLSYNDYMGLKRFAGLDGLRAIAALMVVEQHLANDFLGFIDGFGGVYIFFVLSGYLITTLLLREEAKYQTISIKAFYIRRTFRIFPIYYLVLGLYCFLIFVAPIEELASKQREMARNLPLYIFYMGEFVGFRSAGFGHAWSLGIEEKFYLFWPLIGFVGLRYANRQWRIALIMALAILLLSIYVIYNPGNGFVGYYLLSIGCLLAAMLNNEYWYQRLRSLINSFIGPFFIVVSFAIIYILRPDYEILVTIFPLATALIITLAVIGNGKFAATMDLSPLAFCGRISYGIYLIHSLAIGAVQFVIKPVDDNFWNNVLIFTSSVLLSVFLAWLMYKWIEQPLTIYGRKLAANVKRPQPKPAKESQLAN
jgi:peptidoglycan/LPS O-acetylase OafA/YrhL